MKTTGILRTLAIGLVALTIASCSTTKQNTVKPSNVIPQDRQVVGQSNKLKTYTTEDLAKGIIGGDWGIQEVFGKDAVGETAPYLKFSTDDKVYGNNGCNTINATYKYNPKDSTLSFINPITTLRACGMTGITDKEIDQALIQTHYYRWKIEDDASFLYFFDKSHNLVMTLFRQNFDFLNGTWKITAINDEPIVDDKLKLVFDTDQKKVHGNTGCNIFNGNLMTDMEVPNSISFESVAVTMMLCPDMETQTAFLVALEEASRAKPVHKDKVILYNNFNTPVLTLERTDSKD